MVSLIRDEVPFSNLYRSGYHKKVTVVRGSVSDYDLLLRALNEYQIEACFHLAAQTIVAIANRSPLSTFESNIKGTWNILEACRHSPTVERIVVASSDKAYGEQEKLPYDEDSPLKGSHPYDLSKTCVDLLAQAYYHTYRLPVGITRCANLYGGGDLNFDRVIPGTIRSLYYDEDPIIRSDGTPLRDYLYMKDAASSYLRLVEALDNEALWGQAFNFSLEMPMSVLTVVQELIAASGKAHLKPRILGSGKLKGEIHHQYLSSKKAREMLQWRPQYSFQQGLKETLEWYYHFFEEREAQRKQGIQQWL